MSNPVVYLTRKATFSAAHRLHSKHLSEEENREVFDKCNWDNGHGHNYVVRVTVRGPVCPKTGMVMNITELKNHMDEVILKNLDHKNLDKDVNYFSDKPSTTENLSIYIWDHVRALMKKPELLYEVKIDETDKNSVTYRGPYPSQTKYTNKRCQGGSCNNISSDSD
ncbi:unnamed protein product [Hermetia illucens]|uniref:6-pyruvoyl tetrahydrobiopterin synthase n=1 Tax=Hermetia illucens TaxID=343691 RepID=A0A7R8YY12_HERIL|nr:6-pyruvoyl tetrahydrobiopterin synthase [Hermetia illucens]CAD7086355.1 unnamed protein product [Hermetia illucens]